MHPKQEDGSADAETILSRKLSRPTARGASFELTVVEGPDAGRRLRLSPADPSSMLVGKGSSCELRLTDGQVSRRHLTCEVVGQELRVTDLDSTNGTRVNGVSIVEARLCGGERIQLGATVIALRRGERADVELTSATSFGRMVGASPAMRRLYPLCKKLAASDVPIIIEGETGTGKEVLAESLHELGPRASGPFVVFDCTAVPPNLVESALFGHERGSFTGATESRRGVFEEANGGTLLIDEIGELDTDLQSKLLRALERSEVQRIGSARWLRVNVRFLAATRRNLDQEIQAGRFRDDLFYRLAVARIELPPLRRREGDVALLTEHFWRRIADPGTPLPEDFVLRLDGYSWPGNVRELQNAVARRVALGELADLGTLRGSEQPAAAEAPALRGDSMPTEDAIQRILEKNLPFPRARERVLEEFEGRYVARVLELHGGNAARAAAASGIARRYFRILRARAREREGG